MSKLSKIFISHTSCDLPVAAAIKSLILKAYEGELSIFLASSDILSGEQWKNEILGKLNDSDALISLMTVDSIDKPWLYVEWAHFWLHNKLFYIVHTGDVDLDKLIAPMQDRQSTNLKVKDKVANLFTAVSKNFNLKVVSDDIINEFIFLIEASLIEKLETTYGIYRYTLSGLPDNDDEKSKIARFFYQQKEIDVFIRVSKEIRNDSRKADLINEVFRDSKLNHEAELKVASEISKSINKADKLVSIVDQLIEFNNLDSDVIREITIDIASRYKAGLRKIATNLVELDKEDSDYFLFVCEAMYYKVPSESEFIKIPMKLIDSEKFTSPIFMWLVNMFTNPTVLKNLVIYMQSRGTHTYEMLEKVVMKLASFSNQSPLKAAMAEFLIKDEVLYKRLSNKIKFPESK